MKVLTLSLLGDTLVPSISCHDLDHVQLESSLFHLLGGSSKLVPRCTGNLESSFGHVLVALHPVGILVECLCSRT